MADDAGAGTATVGVLDRMPSSPAAPPFVIDAPQGGGPLTVRVAQLVFDVLGDDNVVVRKQHSPIGEFLVRVAGEPSESTTARMATALRAHRSIEAAAVSGDRVFLRVGNETVVEATTRGGWAEAFPRKTTNPMRAALLFSCPNSNKPLHLGHLRQNAIGMALRRVLAAAGHHPVAASLNGDWGIHIAQAIVGARYVDRGTLRLDKFDHVAGASIAAYHQQVQVDPSVEHDARSALVALHGGDPEPTLHWHRFTGEAMRGHAETYRRIGTSFAFEAFESRELGRAMRLVSLGCARDVFRRRADGSIAADLTENEMWDVTLVRADGTTTCYPQHLAGWDAVYDGLAPDAILVLIGPDLVPMARTWVAMARRLGLAWHDRFFPFAHGLVRSTEGRLRSRYGQSLTIDTVLDAVAARCPDAGLPPEAAADLLKYLFLRCPRTKDATFDQAQLWEDVAPRLARIRDAGQLAAARRHTSRRTRTPDRTVSAVVRDLVVCLDDLPLVATRTLAVLDPTCLVRHVNRLTDLVLACREAPDAGPRLWARASEGLEAALLLLNLTTGRLIEP